MNDTDALSVSASLTIRRLGAADLAGFRDLRLEALRLAPAAFASTAADWEALPDDGWLRALADTVVFAAFLDGQPAALIGLMRQRASKMAHRATLVMIYVRPAARGTGLAAAMLAAVSAHARTLGIRQLELAVTSENVAALRFYRGAGFAEIGRIPAGFLHEGREIDEILMARRIDIG